MLLSPSVGVARERVWCHEVRRGDALSNIAYRYRTTVQELSRLNRLSSKSILPVGLMLALPALAHLRQGALALYAPPLTAAAGNLQRENAQADRQRLSRMRDLRMVRRFVRAGLLVPLPAAASTHWVSGVPASLRVARPWTKRFVEQLARGLYDLFSTRLKITSLTRTVNVQRSLRAWNGNAAPARGENRSSHLTGASVDISKQPLTTREIGWFRQVLGRLARRRLLHAIEEFQQPHFHVMVFKDYLRYALALPAPALIGGC